MIPIKVISHTNARIFSKKSKKVFQDWDWELMGTTLPGRSATWDPLSDHCHENRDIFLDLIEISDKACTSIITNWILYLNKIYLLFMCNNHFQFLF